MGVYRFIQYNTECYNTLVAKTSSDILARGPGQGWGGGGGGRLDGSYISEQLVDQQTADNQLIQ